MEVVKLEGRSFVGVDHVNVRNGNFFISYSNYRDGHGIPFNLTYNSRSSQMGWFGRGWGSPFETRMLYMPDGSAIVHENGTGSYTVYGAPDAARLSREIDQIVDAALRKKPSLNVSAYRADLQESAGSRFEAVKTYGLSQTFPDDTSLAIDMSTTYNSDECEGAPLVSTEGAVGRLTCRNGARIELFQPDGALRSQYYPDIDASLSYLSAEGLVKAIAVMDENGNPVLGLLLTWQGGAVSEVADETEDKTTFTYDERGNLSNFNYIKGNSYIYRYDAHNNMVDIRYIDDTHMKITYDAQDRATSVSDREGKVTTFEYQQDFSDPKAFSTRVTQKTTAGTKVTVYQMHD